MERGQASRTYNIARRRPGDVGAVRRHGRASARHPTPDRRTDVGSPRRAHQPIGWEIRKGEAMRSMASIIRVIDNRVIKRGMRLLLRLDLAPKAVALLETTGRRTGLAHASRQRLDRQSLLADRGARRGRRLRAKSSTQPSRAVQDRPARWYHGFAEVVRDDDPDR